MKTLIGKDVLIHRGVEKQEYSGIVVNEFVNDAGENIFLVYVNDLKMMIRTDHVGTPFKLKKRTFNSPVPDSLFRDRKISTDDYDLQWIEEGHHGGEQPNELED